jgi:hypothetical protein
LAKNDSQKRFIGIDAGTHTGFAVWSWEDKKLVDIRTLAIHEALEEVMLYHESMGGVIVRVEDARLRSYFGTSGPEMWQGAGSIKRDCSIWEDFLEDKGITFQMVAPKNNKTKLKSAMFKRLTGWNRQTSEHARDAAMLVYGM